MRVRHDGGHRTDPEEIGHSETLGAELDEVAAIASEAAREGDRIATLEAERDRLAAALAESQGREAELIGALETVSVQCSREGCQNVRKHARREGNRIERALASPSPAAEAIGKVIEACCEEHRAQEQIRAAFKAHERDFGSSRKAAEYEAASEAMVKATMARVEAVDALQALRSGRAGEGETTVRVCTDSDLSQWGSQEKVLIDSPAKCSRCGVFVRNTTQGKVWSDCDCGGTMKTVPEYHAPPDPCEHAPGDVAVVSQPHDTAYPPAEPGKES